MFGLARLPGSVVQTFGLGRYNELLRFLSVSGPISGDASCWGPFQMLRHRLTSDGRRIHPVDEARSDCK